ncbi:MAG: hypothetical protein HY092_02115, partial [Candidatus Kerfeldbacteria bacterium]|nr:hypothetical protein [Candidatus Kerfeldbacteria bacterium]
TKNDAALANWVKNNIPAAGIIANPGGLYNTWASLTGHPTLWASYNVPTIAEPAPYLASVKHLLRDEPAADVDLLRRRGIEYILVPEQFSVAMYHPRVQLLKQIGRARLYRLSDSSLAVRLPIPLGNGKSNDGISVTTNGHSSCRYCGNAFYFTDQDNLTQLELAPTGTIAITLPADILRRGYPETLLVDHSDGTVDYRTNDSEWKTSGREAIALPQNKSEIIRVIQLRNASKTSRIFFFSMAVQLTK